MQKVRIDESEIFPLNSAQRNSFADMPIPYRLTGPLRLVRLQPYEWDETGTKLVEFDPEKVGRYWFEERVFNKLRGRATRDLLRQETANKRPFVRPLPEMVGMYMKHHLRSDLAISKDWTPDFDTYVVLSLEASASIVAWVGAIADQPYYSKPDPGDKGYADKKQRYDLAEAGGVSLLASERQYLIDFRFAANTALRSAIRKPRPF